MLAAVGPWPRFLARIIDLVLFGIGFTAFTEFVAPEIYDACTSSNKCDTAMGMILIFTWIPIEAISLTVFGATPGKGIFGIRITNREGKCLNVCEALSRSALVWAKGMGCKLPFINLVTCGVAYRRLNNTGSTSWDSRLHLLVSKVEMSKLRGTIAVVLLIGLLSLIIIGALLET